MQKWIGKGRRYEDVDCLPYALEHDRVNGMKAYRIVRRYGDAFSSIEAGTYFDRKRVLKTIRQQYAHDLEAQICKISK